MQTFDGRSASYQYDSAGNLVQSVDLAGNVIGYTYNAQNYPLTMTVAGRGTAFAYATRTTGEIHIAAVTEPNGKVRGYAFNADGSTRVTEPGGGVTTYGNSDGRTASIRNPLNQTTTTTYNAQFLPTAITDALGRTTTFEYDANGNLTKVTDSAGKSSALTYDAKWNLTSATNALGQTIELCLRRPRQPHRRDHAARPDHDVYASTARGQITQDHPARRHDPGADLRQPRQPHRDHRPIGT